MDIPYNLKQALETGNVVLFVGAGMGYNMIDDVGNEVPDGTRLAQALIDRFSVQSERNDLPQISEYIEILNGRSDMCVYIKSILDKANPDEYMKWIPTVKWKAIFTTNYDNCIQKAYDECIAPTQEYITITHLSGFREYTAGYQVPIIHLHGSLYDEKSEDIIITQSDFVKYTKKRKFLFDDLKRHLATSCILFTGYSHNDPNFQIVLDEVIDEITPEPLPQSYRIDPYSDNITCAILNKKNIYTLQCKFTDFVKDARLQLVLPTSNDLTSNHLSDSIPSDFRGVFDNDKVSAIRFFAGWYYVNQLSHLPAPNVHDYVRGNRPSWEIIFNDKYFERNLEEDVLYQLLEYATDAKQKVHVCAVTGSAGYGISTLLMSLARKVVKEHLGKVFYIRAARELREGDILFSSRCFDNEKCFYFIDNAADHARSINTMVKRARELKLNIAFVLGERANELITSSLRLQYDSYEIEPLADSEIESLIDFLDANNELNNLKHLERSDQIAAIKKNYNRELLVAIREATESKSFEAIIADEFVNIPGTIPRQIYAVLACFHQHSAYLRMELLARLYQMNLQDVFPLINDPLKGIIFYDDTNEAKGEFVARTRHRLIAAIVWQNCIPSSEKDEIIHNVLDGMNIAYRTDREAFESFLKSDHLIDSLISLDSRMRFYEKACKMDPDNPFVKQHYARMLIRNNNEQAALRMINDAIEMDPSVRILYHTKGKVLQQIANNAETEDMARKWMGQSEEAYRIAKRMNERDSYSYQGLASLYLDWVQKCSDEQDKTMYLSKAEEIVAEGMQKVVNKGEMWIASSEIDRCVGNLPNQIAALKKAVDISPVSTLSRSLLAKAYMINGQFTEAKEVLQSIMHDDSSLYRVAMDYAKANLQLGESLNNAIAILQQSTLFGYSDPKFIAMLGGLLFLNKNSSDAQLVFDESVKRQMNSINKVIFDPSDIGLANEYSAIVRYIGNGYSQVYVSGFPEIRCRSSKHRGLVLTKNMSVRIKIVFSARSAVALLQ